MNTQALRLSALVAAAMSAGYLWRAALDGDVPQKVLAGVPSELRAEVAQGAVQLTGADPPGFGGYDWRVRQTALSPRRPPLRRQPA